MRCRFHRELGGKLALLGFQAWPTPTKTKTWMKTKRIMERLVKTAPDHRKRETDAAKGKPKIPQDRKDRASKGKDDLEE